MPIGEISIQYQAASKACDDYKRHNLGLGFVIKEQLEKFPTLIDQSRSLSPSYIWLSSGNVNVLNEINFSPYCKIVKASFRDVGMPINLFVQVNSSQRALEAAQAGADAVVLQGIEAGGVNASKDDLKMPTVDELILETRALLEQHQVHEPFLVAAGGIVTRDDVLSKLKLGADAVAVGTLFAIAEESELSAQEKQDIIQMLKHSRTSVTRLNPDGSVVGLGRAVASMPSTIQPAKDILASLTD